ncbi:MAG: hypothetical protein JWN15_1098, partial [Firmicutes bacterium]|nr:hypothetical protein [Bacillota bacterium]
MAEKPRNPRRTENGPAKRNDRAPRKGGPGERPAPAGRLAGK